MQAEAARQRRVQRIHQVRALRLRVAENVAAAAQSSCEEAKHVLATAMKARASESEQRTQALLHSDVAAAATAEACAAHNTLTMRQWKSIAAQRDSERQTAVAAQQRAWREEQLAAAMHEACLHAVTVAERRREQAAADERFLACRSPHIDP